MRWLWCLIRRHGLIEHHHRLRPGDGVLRLEAAVRVSLDDTCCNNGADAVLRPRGYAAEVSKSRILAAGSQLGSLGNHHTGLGPGDLTIGLEGIVGITRCVSTLNSIGDLTVEPVAGLNIAEGTGSGGIIQTEGLVHHGHKLGPGNRLIRTESSIGISLDQTLRQPLLDSLLRPVSTDIGWRLGVGGGTAHGRSL